MIDPDYSIEALSFLLDESCLAERYRPLIEYRERLLCGLRELGCRTGSDAGRLPDEAFASLGLNASETALFRRFLTLYDVKPQKLREIEKLVSDPQKQQCFRELYHLPGVKYVRAELYYRSGYRSLSDLAAASAEEVLEKTALTIAENKMSCIVPLPKEVRTHIAVARAFTIR